MQPYAGSGYWKMTQPLGNWSPITPAPFRGNSKRAMSALSAWDWPVDGRKREIGSSEALSGNNATDDLLSAEIEIRRRRRIARNAVRVIKVIVVVRSISTERDRE